MKIKDLSSLSIAKHEFDFMYQFRETISLASWVQYVEANKDYFVWVEDTPLGKATLNHLEEYEESLRARLLKSHSKREVRAEFNEAKGYYQLQVAYIEYGYLTIVVETKLTRSILERLLDIAEHVGGFLFSDGKKIITADVIDSLFPQ